MNYDINSAIEHLKTSLEEVDSARRQVEKTVNSYSELKDKVQLYVDGFNGISNEVSSLISLLSEHKNVLLSDVEKIETSFNDNCGKAINKFKNAVDSAKSLIEEEAVSVSNKLNDCITSFNSVTEKGISSFGEECEKIREGFQTQYQECLNNLNSGVAKIQEVNKELLTIPNRVKDSLNNSIKEIKTLVDGVSAMVSSTEEALVSCNSEISKCFDKAQSIETGVTEVKNEISSKFDKNNADIAKCFEKIEGIDIAIKGTISSDLQVLRDKSTIISDKITGLEKQNDEQKTIISDLQKEVGKLKNQINTIASGVNTNRWIAIAGFVVVVILMFVFKK